ADVRLTENRSDGTDRPIVVDDDAPHRSKLSGALDGENAGERPHRFLPIGFPELRRPVVPPSPKDVSENHLGEGRVTLAHNAASQDWIPQASNVGEQHLRGALPGDDLDLDVAVSVDEIVERARDPCSRIGEELTKAARFRRLNSRRSLGRIEDRVEWASVV